jgi:hypothetical protein
MTKKPIQQTEQLDDESIQQLDEGVKRIYVPFQREVTAPAERQPPPARRHGS